MTDRVYVKLQTTQCPFSDGNGHQIFYVPVDCVLLGSDGHSWETISKWNDTNQTQSEDRELTQRNPFLRSTTAS